MWSPVAARTSGVPATALEADFNAPSAEQAVSNVSVGVLEVNGTMPAQRWPISAYSEGCPRHRGIILICVGSSTLFSAILLLFGRKATTSIHLWTVCALDVFLFGAIVAGVGTDGCHDVELLSHESDYKIMGRDLAPSWKNLENLENI